MIWFWRNVSKVTRTGGTGKTDLLQVDLRVGAHARLADEVDDPLLALITRKVEALREIAEKNGHATVG